MNKISNMWWTGWVSGVALSFFVGFMAVMIFDHWLVYVPLVPFAFFSSVFLGELFDDDIYL